MSIRSAGSQIKYKKYTVLVGALLAQLTIAGLYAWSIFSTAIIDEYGWGENQVILTYAIAQFVFALSTIVSGRLVDRRGPKITLTIGGILYGSGLILSSFAKSPLMLHLSYGVITGMGVGFVYVCPLSTLIKWFPDKKGTITGLSVAIFGGGSIIFKEIISFLLEGRTVSEAFFYLGIGSAVVIFLASQLVSLPRGYHKKALRKGYGDYTTQEMVKSSVFYKIWFMYWLAVIPGLLILGAAKNIGLDANLTPTAAASLVTLLALANATSRLISGTLSDTFGTLKIIKLAFCITVVSLVFLTFFGDTRILFYTGIMGVAFGYGGFLSLFPILTNQTFGSFRYGSNYGIVYQAYGIAALSGIGIKALVGSYTNTFLISAIAGVIGLFLAMLIGEKK